MLDSSMIKSAFTQGGETLLYLIRDVVDAHTSEECEKAFLEAREIGIDNSIRVMIAVSTSNDLMVPALNNVWGMTRKEAAEHIARVKRELAIERLDETLTLKGMSLREIDEFHSIYDVRHRINQRQELFDCWDDPERLHEKLVAMGKSRENPILPPRLP